MDNLFALSIEITIISVIISFVLAFIRLALGPTLADRVVALDLIAYLTIAFICAYTIKTGVDSYLDIAITLALVAFLSTLAFARHIMAGSKDEEQKS